MARFLGLLIRLTACSCRAGELCWGQVPGCHTTHTGQAKDSCAPTLLGRDFAHLENMQALLEGSS